MIVEFFISIASGIADWGLGLLGSAQPAEWVTTVGTFVNSTLQSVAGLGAWVPWDFAIGVSATVLTLWLLFLLVKAIRWVVGWFPTMGGS